MYTTLTNFKEMHIKTVTFLSVITHQLSWMRSLNEAFAGAGSLIKWNAYSQLALLTNDDIIWQKVWDSSITVVWTKWLSWTMSELFHRYSPFKMGAEIEARSTDTRRDGSLTRYENCGLRMRRECRDCFLRHRLQRKQLISDPGMRHGTCVTHVPWCMSGSLTRGGGENVPGISGACTTRNLTYLVRGPWCGLIVLFTFNIVSQ